jgi:hypothetical protein
MSAETQAAAGGAGESGCWCCGRAISQDALVHLSNHPEVGICINCVHFLGRRARDYQAPVIRRRLRGIAGSIRGEVMTRGGHERPVVGPALKWLNRHLPW